MSAVLGSQPAMRVSGAAFVTLLHVGLIAALIGGLSYVSDWVPPPGPFHVTPMIETSSPPPGPSVPPVAVPLPPPQGPLDLPPISAGPGSIHQMALVQPRTLPGWLNPRPDYPEVSIRLGEEGSVVLLLLVGTDGRVSEAKVETSSGYPRLDEAAAAQARRSYRFEPGTENGVPKAMWHRIKVTFRLKDVRG